MCNKQTSFCLLLLDLETVQLNGNDNNVISQSVKSYDAEIFEENKEPEESHCASAKLGNEQAGALNIWNNNILNYNFKLSICSHYQKAFKLYHLLCVCIFGNSFSKKKYIAVSGTFNSRPNIEYMIIFVTDTKIHLVFRFFPWLSRKFSILLVQKALKIWVSFLADIVTPNCSDQLFVFVIKS